MSFFVAVAFVILLFLLWYRFLRTVRLGRYATMSMRLSIGRHQEDQVRKFGSIIFEISWYDADIREIAITDITGEKDKIHINQFNKLLYYLDDSYSQRNLVVAIGMYTRRRLKGVSAAYLPSLVVKGYVLKQSGVKHYFSEHMTFAETIEEV